MVLIGNLYLTPKRCNLDNLLLVHIELLHVLVLAVHLVNFFGWMSQGGHSEQLLFFALFYQSTPSYLKVGALGAKQTDRQTEKSIPWAPVRA